MFMDWLRKAPTTVVITVIIVCGAVALGVLGAFVTLSLQGVDTTEFRQWINTVGQILVFPFLGAATVASVSAAKSASKAEDNSNGVLESRDRKIQSLTESNDKLRGR
jgi:NADH:ubiquinone oxidoreductase subunit 6 (subunit J)